MGCGWPSGMIGVGKSGSCGLPSTSVSEQRRAIATVLAMADGMSANSACISAVVLKCCSLVKRLMRLGLPSASPSAMHTRASWASKSSGARNWMGCVATTGSLSLAASGTAARMCGSLVGWPPRCNSM